MKKMVFMFSAVLCLALIGGIASAGTVDTAGPDVAISNKLSTASDITSGRHLFVNSGGLAVGSTSTFSGQLKINNSNLVVTNTGNGDQFAVQTDGMLANAATATYKNVKTGGTWRFLTSQAASGDTETLTIAADGTVSVPIMEIRGGADLSESFDIASFGDTQVAPGMVVAIDPSAPGKLMLSHDAYDTKVAGIVSGAGGLNPGMLMGQAGSIASGSYPVALTGRVYCHVDQSNGVVMPGDMLTTSAKPGHAMKVTDFGKALGSVIGKAMTSANEDGLVMVLVGLK